MTTNPEPIQQVIQELFDWHAGIGTYCDVCEMAWPCPPTIVARELQAALAEVERLRAAIAALPEPWVLSRTPSHKYRYCSYCHWHEENPEGHAPDCPWRALAATQEARHDH